MIARLSSRAECIAMLQEGYRFNVVSAEGLYAEVWREIRVLDEQTLPERRARLQATLEAVCAAAFADKQYPACIAAVREIKKMFGVDMPLKVQALPSGKATEFGERSEADLEFFSEHGYWPEEVAQPGAKNPQQGGSPLDRLVH